MTNAIAVSPSPYIPCGQGAGPVLTPSYSICVDKQPLRVAYLVKDKPQSIAIIHAISAQAAGAGSCPHAPAI
jgi:hypothetical protein